MIKTNDNAIAAQLRQKFATDAEPTIVISVGNSMLYSAVDADDIREIMAQAIAEGDLVTAHSCAMILAGKTAVMR